jgi:1-deoxy-D-xylulose-5-phosphate synthase
MSILEKINKPQDLHDIKKELLPELAKEIRAEMIKDVAANGGHLAPSLGTVELAIAIHYVFDAPNDKVIWDVGHQAYAHKLLTGRNKSFSTLRQHGGISGFPKRSESVYDAFGVGHSSTSISAALGFAVARDMQKKDNKVVAVIGDGSMTGGLSYEALLNTGHIGTDMLVILNDNEMFISHRVGALAGYLTKLLTAGSLKKLEKKVEKFFKRIHFWGAQILRVAKRFKVLLFPGMLFEEMGFSYLGPIDGHDIYRLIDILENIKKLKSPVLLHVLTKKGKGYGPAEYDPTLFHGIGKFDIATGKPESSGSTTPSYTSVFGKTMIRLAREDKRVVAITAAMQDGTGLDEFRKEFPDRFFDVGIAEEHAATFAAGLACEGIKPVFAIYSTFLQRSLDQMIHDVALQNLGVIFAIDRAGLVGEDGPTHHGAFDLSFINFIPNFTIMAPSDENEFQHMLKTAISIEGPVALRYPRGAAMGVTLDPELKTLPLGKARVLKDGKDLYILAIGNMVWPSMEASKLLESQGISAGVIDMRFLKPIDRDLILSLAKNSKNFVTVEENSIVGGLGSTINSLLSSKGCEILNIGLPDQFIEHGNPKVLRSIYNLTEEKISTKIKDWVKDKK